MVNNPFVDHDSNPGAVAAAPEFDRFVFFRLQCDYRYTHVLAIAAFSLYTVKWALFIGIKELKCYIAEPKLVRGSNTV